MLPISTLHVPRNVSSVALTISSISLASNPTDIWRYLFGNEPLPEAWKDIESISISNMHISNFSQVDAFIRIAYGLWQPENVQAGTEMGYRFSMYGYLSTRRYELFHAERLGDRARRKYYDTTLLQCRHVYDLFSEQKGEMIPHFAVAMPLVLFATEILNVDKELLSIQMDTAGYSAFGGTNPDILVTDNMCTSNVMCVEIKASSDEIDAAWEEAIGASMLLDSRTGFSTVVMAQAGNIIRIALLTIRKRRRISVSEPAQDTANANTSSESDENTPPVMSDDLPHLIHTALYDTPHDIHPVARSVPTITRGDVRLLYGIEFDANALHSEQFVATLRSYFEYILRRIRYFLTHQRVAVAFHNEHVKECYIGSNHFMCKLMRQNDPLRLKNIHQRAGLPLDAIGHVEIHHTTKFGISRRPIMYIRHSWVEGRRADHIDNMEGSFKELCGAVVALHEKGIIHCDIRRPNVIVDTLGKVALIDYEFAMEIGGEFNPPEHLKTSAVFKQFLNFISSEDEVEDCRKASQLLGSNSQLCSCLFDIYCVFHFVYFSYDTNVTVAAEQAADIPPADTAEQATVVMPAGDFGQTIASSARKSTTSASSRSHKRQRAETSETKSVLEFIDTNIEYATFVHGCVTAIIELSNESDPPAHPTRFLIDSIMRSVFSSLPQQVVSNVSVKVVQS